MKNNPVIFENQPLEHIRIAYPDVLLKPLIEYYFEINTGGAFHTMKGLPAVNTLLAFQLSGTAWTSSKEGGPVQQFRSSQLLGHISAPFNSSYAPGTHLFFIKLRPGSAFRLFEFPPEELENAQADLGLVLKAPGLEDQLQHAGSFAARVQLAEAFFLKRLQQLAAPDFRQQVVQQCIRKYESLQLKDEKGLTHLCASLHVTYASLRRYFLATTGVTPKFVQKTVRFKKALLAYRTHGYNFYYEDFGYTDFSHFVKDAKALTGAGPLEL